MATFNGTEGNDNISGTTDTDTINGFGGNDFLAGNSGDDSIVGGSGNDTIYGDGGNDWVEGGTGDDLISGSGGQDSIVFRRIRAGHAGSRDRIRPDLGRIQLEAAGFSNIRPPGP